MVSGKIELLLSLRDKFKTGLTAAKQKLRNGVGDMKRQIGDLKNSHVQAFSAMKAEVPVLGRMVGMLANPYALAAAAVVGLGIAAAVATQKAADFNSEFLHLRNLNLDKSQEQINELKNNILDLSMETGRGAIELSKAFYDVQSATGKFGQEVEDIVKTVANFSTATKAELPAAINATTKAMKAFGLQTNEVEGYLMSSAKTVQVGIVTFNDLARTQTEYGAAAAAAGQELDTANKVMAAFTAAAKDANIGANMTKTAFTGLTQDSTIKGLHDIGVELLDSNKNMKDMDTIIKELVPKIAKMNDQQFLEMRNAIGGPEGLQMLFNQLRTAGDDVLRTFDEFDNTKINLDDMLANAMGDFNTLKEILGNQINTLMIKFGEEILPVAITALHMLTSSLTGIADVLEVVGAGLGAAGTAWALFNAKLLITKGVLGIVTAAQWALNLAMTANPIGLIVTGIGLLVGGLVLAYKKSESFRAALGGILEVGKTLLKIFTGLGKVLVGAITRDLAMVNQGVRESAGAIQDIMDNGVGGIYERGRIRVLKQEQQESLNPEAEGAGGGGDGTKDPAEPTKPAGGDVTKVVGDSKAARNLTVNIDSLHKGDINVSSQNVSAMSSQQLEKWFQDMLMRTMRNMEASV